MPGPLTAAARPARSLPEPFAAGRPRASEHFLQTRMAGEGTASRRVGDLTKQRGAQLWQFLRRHPVLGTAAVGSATIGLAAEIGVAEVALGSIAASGAFKVLRTRGRPTPQAQNAGR